ncbi:MAG TPA: outer membrane protein assembly factor BamA [Opitutus sp.]|nr:outer membrane protein assembly factor BamA [Opitutus sp.]
MSGVTADAQVGTPAGGGQQQQAEPVYKVGTITIKFVGAAVVSEQVVRANMQVKEGGDLDDAMLDRDIRSLYKTGLFEFIEIKRQQVSPDVFNLVVEVTPKFRVLAVRFEGNHKVRTHRLEKEVKSRPNTALDERQVKEDSEKLREYYQKAGYNQVSVAYTIERDRATSFGTIIFKIHEGERVKIAGVDFSGNAHVKAKHLRHEMETKKWWMFSWLLGTGRFKDDEFEDDLDKLRDYYRERGYLDVQIPEEKVVFSYPKPGRLLITINITEGRQYHIGEITFTGNKLHPSALLRRVVRQRSGMIFSPSKLDKDVERIQDFYGHDGYLDTYVKLERKPNIATGNIDIAYSIEESDKFHVESIELDGNTKTKSTVIVRELVLGPGDVFDTVRMKISKLRLENTRFFDDVSVTPQETNIPGRRNLRVSVKEGRTGNLSFGAGFSSLERATVFAELSQGNFDLFNRRSLFQGAGQKFRLKLSIGSLSSEVAMNFEEPWLFEQELAVGFEVFRTSSEYNSTFYTEIDSGFEVYLRKHLFGLLEGRLSYTYEVVGIHDVSASASPILKAFAGDNAVSKIGFQILRDTRDKIINTTRGNRMELDLAVAGGPLGGENDFYSLEFRGAQYFPIFEAQNQVLALLGRGGVIQNYGSSPTVAYYNKFYLGGPNDLRGYEFRDISPRDEFGEVVGGKTYAFLSAEYSLDIVSPVRFAMFYDAGFVNKGAYDFSPAQFSDDFGFGLRLFVAGSPLSLDFGIPLTGPKEAKKGNQFNFSFGTRY